MRVQVDTTQRKKKQTIKKKKGKKPYANRTLGYEMTINDNKKNLRQKIVICHKSSSDKGALAMMCGKDEKFRPTIVTC